MIGTPCLRHHGRRSPGDPPQLRHVGDIEIAHPVTADLAVTLQRLEGGDGVGKRYVASPVQQVDIDASSGEALQAALACRDGAMLRGVVRIDLADDEDLLVPPGNRLTDDLLGTALAIHLGGVDQGDAAIDAVAERSDRRSAIAATLAETPSTLAKNWHLLA